MSPVQIYTLCYVLGDPFGGFVLKPAKTIVKRSLNSAPRPIETSPIYTVRSIMPSLHSRSGLGSMYHLLRTSTK